MGVVDSTIGALGGETYSTVTAWEAATDVDITAGGTDEQHNGRLTQRLTVTAELRMTGATTDSTHFRRLTFDNGIITTLAPYDPITDTGVGLVRAGNEVIRTRTETFTQLVGLLFEGASASTQSVYNGGVASSLMDGCTLRQTGTTGGCYRGDGAQIFNSLGLTTGGVAWRQNSAVDCIYYNCIAYDSGGGTGSGFQLGTDAASTIIRNCIAIGWGASNGDFTGTLTLGTYSDNISGDTSAPGAGSFTSETDTDLWTSPSTDDFTLKSGGNAIDNGFDLSGTFTTSLDGTTRTTPWDMGVYDFAAALSAGAFLKVPTNVLLRM